jgi:hypothetical protein
MSFMLRVSNMPIMLSVCILCVIILNVVAPTKGVIFTPKTLHEIYPWFYGRKKLNNTEESC